MNQSESNLTHWHQAWENACKQVTIIIGFGFVSDWLRKWCEFLTTITQHDEAKPKQI